MQGKAIETMTAVAPDGDCPRWRSFLSWFSCGDVKVEQFLKRYCGYSLTGLTDEQALLFLYGFGGNGKTVFLRTVAGVLGNYHTTASMDVFTATNLPRHETELARLHGARSVTATETEEGKRWDEALDPVKVGQAISKGLKLSATRS